MSRKIIVLKDVSEANKDNDVILGWVEVNKMKNLNLARIMINKFQVQLHDAGIKETEIYHRGVESKDAPYFFSRYHGMHLV